MCNGGELFERITEKGAGYSEEEARNYFTQLMKAIQYMHSKKIVHRDIKPENLLFVKPGSNHLKLIDFGISKIFCPDGDANSAIKLHTKAGSVSSVDRSCSTYLQKCLKATTTSPAIFGRPE